MNTKPEIKLVEKENLATVNSTKKQTESQQEIMVEKFFVMPSVPRPGKTCWSLVL